MRRAAIMSLALLAGACAAPRLHQTTMLDSVDVVAMTDAMAESLGASTIMEFRTAASPEMVITMDRVSNRTEHIMSPGERWGIMNRFRALLMRSDLREARSLVFVMPRHAWDAIDAVEEPPPTRRPPTHALRATFLSDTRSSVSARADAYHCAFQLFDLDDGRILWEDAFEMKYAVTRNAFD